MVFTFTKKKNNISNETRKKKVYWSVNNNCHIVRVILILISVNLWSWRLTWNWWRGWHGLSHEDWRYVKFRKYGLLIYWLVSFTSFHFMPTVLVYLATIPYYYALIYNSNNNQINLWNFVFN